MTHLRGPKGTAYNNAVFTSHIARAGGPVRLSIDSIDRNSSREGLYKEVLRRGWGVVEIGGCWLLFDNQLRIFFYHLPQVTLLRVPNIAH